MMERILGPLPKHMIEKTRYVLLVMSSVVVNTTGFRLELLFLSYLFLGYYSLEKDKIRRIY